MTWERRIAVAVALLFLVLCIRGLRFRTGDKIGLLPADGVPEEAFHLIYFGTADGEFLVPEFRAGEGTIGMLLTGLVEGPRTPGLAPVLPPQTEVLSYNVQGRVLFVNFSHHLANGHPGGSRAEILTVYGIVNTLVGTEEIEWVQILVENERLPTLAGHISIDEPLHKDYTILGASAI